MHQDIPERGDVTYGWSNLIQALCIVKDTCPRLGWTECNTIGQEHFLNTQPEVQKMKTRAGKRDIFFNSRTCLSFDYSHARTLNFI